MTRAYYKKSKYGAIKCVVDGIKFDSKKESQRYLQLKAMEESGEIKNLQLQVRFELIPSQYDLVGNKMKCIERKCEYIADFVYDLDGTQVVEDAKGLRTDAYRIKKKLMLYVHHIKIKEV